MYTIYIYINNTLPPALAVHEIYRDIFGPPMANQGNLAESFLKIAVYLTFPYLIPYKILHLYLPEMSVRMTYPSHPRKTRNTPSCTSMYP